MTGTKSVQERPIMFSAPMVRALLDGRKTQTRRLLKPQPHPDFLARGVCGVVAQWPQQDGFRWFMKDGMSELVPSKWKPRQLLWVREAWHTRKEFDKLKPSEVGQRVGKDIFYPADNTLNRISGCREEFVRGRLRPSMFMPRWASRITLELTEVRVERLQTISDADITAEGVTASLVSEIIDPVALRANAVPEHWIGGADQGFGWCRQCAEKEVRRLKKADPTGEYYVDGGWSTEGDSQAFCEGCQRTLDNSFTTYACEAEIDHFRDNNWSLSPLDCLSLQNILGSYGWDDPERCAPEDRIAPDIHRLGYQALYESINRRGSGKSNPWVFVLTFNVLEKEYHP